MAGEVAEQSEEGEGMKLGEDFFNDEYVPAVCQIKEPLDWFLAEAMRTDDLPAGTDAFLDEVLPLAKTIERLRALREGAPQ